MATGLAHRLYGVVGVLAVVGVLVGVATPAWGSSPVGWRVVGRIDASGLSGLSCPVASMCVAVDGQGDVVSSADPAGGGAAWQTVNVDGSNRLVGVSCPSVSLCAAVDDAGNVLTSVDPTGRAAGWSVANVEGTSPFVGVSCPSVSLCVAATASDLLVSRDPSAGASSWRVFSGADDNVGPECGKYGGDSGCAVSMILLSCSSASYCVAVDDEGGSVAGDPVTGAWASGGGAVGIEIEGLACLPGQSRCLTECAVGAGLGGDECSGGIYDEGDICASQCFTVTPSQAAGLWCSRASLCFATDESGDLFASTDPGGGGGAWWRAFVDTGGVPEIIRYNPLVGISCPPGSRCVAADARGGILVGEAPPKANAIRRLLIRQITPSVHRIAAILERRGYRFTLRLGMPGRLRIAWHLASRLGQPMPQQKRALVATANDHIAATGAPHVKIRLTDTGKLILAHSTRVTVTATATFKPAGSKTITARTAFRLVR